MTNLQAIVMLTQYRRELGRIAHETPAHDDQRERVAIYTSAITDVITALREGKMPAEAKDRAKGLLGV